MIEALEAYLRELRDIRSSGAGVKETSYYPALVALLNEAGKGLSPRVRCISQLANHGAGSPDIGLFDRTQFRIAALLLLGPALDANYGAVKAHTYAWPGAT